MFGLATQRSESTNVTRDEIRWSLRSATRWRHEMPKWCGVVKRLRTTDLRRIHAYQNVT